MSASFAQPVVCNYQIISFFEKKMDFNTFEMFENKTLTEP